ncbi:molybdenum cofactor guanylyltransferase [Sphingobium sp. SCG-1]|uniref:molybdenum cofactor guanylyltransferase n=1 Tax=Sphingobium sp. SCG-1 TaxID=2072936 RepID=UPI000CD6BE3F|nr:molybdenum cofactor guanylyltransferase [Sphingobium sp. SCG-1]AUW58323.1 molybdenum cofactor guanylyltransferase [Sphingobium sp. SCG-1]
MTHGISSERILGAVLAGGQSSRFGSDKALALLGNKALLVHATERLAKVSDTVIICGRTEGKGIAIPDRPAGNLGPLGGLNAALHYARDHGFDRVLSAGCDTPILPDHLLRRLTEQPDSTIFDHMPIVGIWSSNLADALDSHLEHGDDRSVKRWARSIGVRVLLSEEAIPNINTPDELDAISVAQGGVQSPRRR